MYENDDILQQVGVENQGEQIAIDPEYKKKIDIKMIKVLATKLGFVLLLYFGIRELSTALINFLFKWDYVSFTSSMEQALVCYIALVAAVLLISVISLVLPFFILKLITKKETLKKSDSFEATQGKGSAIGISLGAMTLGQIMAGLFAVVLFIFGIGANQQLGEVALDPLAIIILIIEVILIPAIFEELAFRKYLLNSLRRFSDGFALVVSSAIFGLIHLNGTAWIYAFVLGLILGYYALKTGSIKTSMLIHGICNSVSLISAIVIEAAGESVGNIVTLGLFAASGIVGLITAIYTVKKKGYLFGKLSSNGNLLTVSQRIKAVALNPLIVGAICVIMWLTINTLYII